MENLNTVDKKSEPNFIKRNFAGIVMTLIMTLMTFLSVVNPAFASMTESDANTMWNSIVKTVIQWIRVLGAFVMVWGGINIGLSFQSDDPNQRTNGIKTLIAGVIVIAVISLANQWLTV